MCEEEKCVRGRNVSGGEMCQEEKCVRRKSVSGDKVFG